MGSVSKLGYCASCGQTEGQFSQYGDVLLCARCEEKIDSGETLSLDFLTDISESPTESPPEVRFEELFKAARALLRNCVIDEDEIYPTLQFANAVGQGNTKHGDAKERLVKSVEHSEKWRAEADRFVSEYLSLRPLKVVDEVLLLERLPASVQIHNYPETDIPQKVEITAYPHRVPASPEHVANLYEETLSDAGIPCGESTKGYMGFEFDNDRLYVRISQRRPVYTAYKHITWPATPFPRPTLVREFYRALLGTSSNEGFARRLATRRRGGPPAADNLIPAYVACLLKNVGGIEERKNIHRLLNEYVLRETWKKPLPNHNSSEVVQLWRDAKKVEERLRANAYALRSPKG